MNARMFDDMHAGWAQRAFVFAKAPRMGRAKTRLAADVGPVAAARFARVSADTLLARIGGDPRWRTILAVDPPGWTQACVWPSRYARVPQAAGDLGARMAAVFRRAPPGPAVILGADAPEVDARDVAAAFRALEGCDAVFGPSEDGGYWLIGLRRMRPAPALFDGVRWSTEHALADTRATLPARFRVAELRTMRDVDHAEDLALAEPILRAMRRRGCD